MEALVHLCVTRIGAPEGIVRLVLGVVAGYPLGLLHRRYLYGKSANLQHIYFIISGLYLIYFNYGVNTIHSVINILIMYILLRTMGGTRTSAVIAHVFNMVYLVVGYYCTMCEEYTVRWTTTHCILTLRLTGMVVDVYYGHMSKTDDKLSEDEKETAVDRVPSLLEVAGYSYYCGGVLVGPQFSLRRFQKFVNGEFCDSLTLQPPACIKPGLLRFGAGVLFIASYQITNMFLPDRYLYSPEFEELSIVQRYVWVTVWAKLAIYKYFGVWLLSEGVCILTSLAYNGKDENGNILWDGCRNVHIVKFEMAQTIPEIISAFHVSVRRWLHKYIYRLFKSSLGAEMARLITLIYVALWHGLWSGYYMAFFIQFAGVRFEKQASNWLARIPCIKALLKYSWGQSLRFIVKKLWVYFGLSYFAIAFYVMTYDKWWKVFSSLYWGMHIVLFIIWPLVDFILTKIFGKYHRPKLEQNGGKKTN